MPLRMPRRAAMLLKSGQTTQYDSEEDDGYFEKGIAKAYTVLSTGQYAGTSNIDLIHLTDISIAFAATTPGTITDSNNGLAIFQTGDVLIVTGTASNDGVYNISTGGVAGTIRTTEATLLEAAGAPMSLAKREALSNNCVIDDNTGLMWARYMSEENAAMGIASDGKMPWTGELYDIFQYCAAANAASLGGYTDWRVSNLFEMWSLAIPENGVSSPDGTAFPGWTTDAVWSATSYPLDVMQGKLFDFDHLRSEQVLKTSAQYCALVRGGV